MAGAMRGAGAVCLDPVSRGAVWLLAVGGGVVSGGSRDEGGKTRGAARKGAGPP